MKVSLLREAFCLGAHAADLQPNLGYLKSGMLDSFRKELAALVEAGEGRALKTMSEFCFLTEEERILCITLAEEAGVAHMKKSSGKGPRGSPVTVEDIRFMKQHLKGRAKIKASGERRSYEQVIALLDAGADLIGTSAGPEIFQSVGLNDSAY